MTPQQAKLVLEEITLRATQRMSLEQLLTSKHGFALETATPVQRAICRIAEGVPIGDVADDPDVIQAIGDMSLLPKGRPDGLVIASGTRTGKSLIASVLAVRASQSCDVSILSKGDIPRFSIVSLRKDLADVIFGHVVGNITSQPALKALLLEEPTAGSCYIRDPLGRPFEIKVVAGAKAGGSLVARWSAGVVYDEFTRMLGDGEGVINLDDMRKSVHSRLLPGAMQTYIGSPWAPFGPAYDMITKNWGKPSKKMVVIWCKADKLNPVWWTPERAEELKLSDPDSYRTDYEARFLEPEELFFSASMLESSTREHSHKPPEDGHTYVAGMDPATRSNAWTVVIGTRNGENRIVNKVMQWTPGKGEPLDPHTVFADMAEVMREYRVDRIVTDQWAVDALRAVARQYDIELIQNTLKGQEVYEAYSRVKTWLEMGDIDLPPDQILLGDLKRVRKKVTQSGISIDLPVTGDGRHCDYAPALVRMLNGLYEDYVEPPPTDKEHILRLEAEKMERAASERASRQVDIVNWWDA